MVRSRSEPSFGLAASASSMASALAQARATVRRAINPESSIPDRISAIEKNLAKIDEDIGAAFSEIDRREGAIQEKIRAEADERTRVVDAVKRDLKDATSGNYAVLAFGAIWLAIGIVLATGSPEISKIVAGQWTEIVKTL